VQRFKPDFFGIEQGVCNKKNGKKQSQVELAFVFLAYFPRTSLILREYRLFLGNFGRFLLKKYQLCGCYLTERSNRLTPFSKPTTQVFACVAV